MSKAKLATGADLPAPLSLTLDEVRNVAGGVSLSTLSAVHWWWYGQPAWGVGPNVTAAQVGAAQALGG